LGAAVAAAAHWLPRMVIAQRLREPWKEWSVIEARQAAPAMSEEQRLTPYPLGRGVLAHLRRAAQRRRHNFHYLRRLRWELIERYLRPVRGEYICDVASGDGYYSHKIAARGARVAAVDIDPRRIRAALTYHNAAGIEYRLGSVAALPYPDHTFDKVVSVCALEHFHDPQAAINEAWRVLKPDGRLVLHVDSFTYRAISPAVREHHRLHHYVENFFTIQSLSALLKNAPFQIDEYRYAFNSPLAHRFFAWGEMRDFTGVPFLAAFPVAYPLIKLSDKVLGRRNEGYDLFVRATRREQ
jgi:2-polyprenyl-3-methyl-5-hydroxy-6-metoxy-1,4-benzoquinol methylase